MHLQATQNQKSQGLSFNTIVLAIIALIVLVVIVLFVTGGFARFAQGFRGTETSKVEDLKNQCRLLCERAKLNSQSAPEWKNSAYCKSTFDVDWADANAANGPDGTMSPNFEDNIRCWSYPISVGCSATITETKDTGITYQAMSVPADTAADNAAPILADCTP